MASAQVFLPNPKFNYTQRGLGMSSSPYSVEAEQQANRIGQIRSAAGNATSNYMTQKGTELEAEKSASDRAFQEATMDQADKAGKANLVTTGLTTALTAKQLGLFPKDMGSGMGNTAQTAGNGIKSAWNSMTGPSTPPPFEAFPATSATQAAADAGTIVSPNVYPANSVIEGTGQLSTVGTGLEAGTATGLGGATSATGAGGAGYSMGAAGEAGSEMLGGATSAGGGFGNGAFSGATSQPYGLYYAAGHYAGKALNDGPIEKNWGSNEYPAMSPIASLHRGPGRLFGDSRGEELAQKMEGPEQVLWGEKKWDSSMWRDVLNPRLDPVENLSDQYLPGDVGKTISTIVNPVGKGLEALCIIVTACTSPDSEEVNISREYRDRFLTQEQLRGYYIAAEVIVPRIYRSKFAKDMTRFFLVGNLVEYGRYALDKGPAPSMLSILVTKAFIGMCGAIGKRRKSFVRSNGEAV